MSKVVLVRLARPLEIKRVASRYHSAIMRRSHLDFCQTTTVGHSIITMRIQDILYKGMFVPANDGESLTKRVSEMTPRWTKIFNFLYSFGFDLHARSRGA
jgi:hypothetical protein